MANVEAHPYWHRFDRGGCLACGYHCIDCPKKVISCKCTPKIPHTFSDTVCKGKYCRLHWYPSFGEHKQYPFTFNMLTSEQGWVTVTIFCGPGAFYPRKEKK